MTSITEYKKFFMLNLSSSHLDKITSTHLHKILSSPHLHKILSFPHLHKNFLPVTSLDFYDNGPYHITELSIKHNYYN